MSFGAARSRALCTIRLSPGNTLTVQAGPWEGTDRKGWQGRCQRAERRTARARWHRPDPQDDTHARAQVIDNEPNHPLSLPMESVALAQHQDVRPGQMGSDFCRTILARARGCP